MGSSLPRFDGKVIAGSRSTGSGVFAAFDWRDMVLHPGQRVKQKAMSEFGRVSDFPAEDRPALTAVLGHYSNLQSLNSEDAITWSVFGALSLDPWVDSLLDSVGGPSARPQRWSAEYWKRQPHPDTGQQEVGPEADVSLQAGKWRYEIEAKWLSDICDGQGARRNQTQIEMRASTASRLAGNDASWGVVLVVPSQDRYPQVQKAYSVFRKYFKPAGDGYLSLPRAQESRAVAVTWESIATILAKHHTHKEVADYLNWRLQFLPG